MSNHLGDTNKMVDTPRTNQVSIRPQYGDEWDWCRADFARQLERELNAANDRIKRLEEAGDALENDNYTSDNLEAWRKAKEDKL